MPTAAELRAINEKLQQEQARSKAYYQEGEALKKGLSYYEERIADLEAQVRAYKSKAKPAPEAYEVNLAVMRTNLPALKQATVRQQSYCDRQAEGYAKIIASIPSGNETLQAYYEAYVTEAAALEDLMLQIDEALRS
jgi:chromosome segregation ATPase